MTQEDLAYKSGVSLFFVREMEQGKVSLRMDKSESSAEFV